MACFQYLKGKASQQQMLHVEKLLKEVFPFNFVILIKYSKESSFKTKTARKSLETGRKQCKK